MFNKEIYSMWEKENYEVIREIGPLDRERMMELMEDVDALIVGTDELTEDILKAANKLKIISKYGVGIDNIPKDFAEEKGIKVLNTPGVNTEAVADYTFSLLLSVARHVPQSHEKLLHGQWAKSVGTEVYGKTIGILGFGAIGRAVAKRARGFDMDILAYDLFPNYELAEEMDVKISEFDTIIEQSDILSVHLPLVEETKNLLNYPMFKRMKKNSIIVNTARGGIINEADLAKALKEELIFGAGMDVFSTEPLTESPLFECENAILTPHNAAASSEAITRMTVQATQNVLEFFTEKQESV